LTEKVDTSISSLIYLMAGFAAGVTRNDLYGC